MSDDPTRCNALVPAEGRCPKCARLRRLVRGFRNTGGGGFENLSPAETKPNDRTHGKEPEAPTLGGFDKWLSSPESKQYAGQHVAWLPGTGVIEIAPTADELIDKLDGNQKEEEASIAIVPTWQAVTSGTGESVA